MGTQATIERQGRVPNPEVRPVTVPQIAPKEERRPGPRLRVSQVPEIAPKEERRVLRYASDD